MPTVIAQELAGVESHDITSRSSTMAGTRRPAKAIRVLVAGANEGVTEIVEMPGRGHALTIDNGWREVAETALAFVRRFA